MPKRQNFPANGCGAEAPRLIDAFLSARLSGPNLTGTRSVVLRFFSKSSKLLVEFLQLLVGQIFKIDQFISCVFEGADDLIEFEMHCFGIAVLRILDQEHHEERDDRRGGVDDQLPGIGKMKRRSGEKPHEDDEHSSGKSPCAAENNRRLARENAKRILDDTKKSRDLSRFFNLSV